MQSSENLNSVTVAKFKVNQWTVKERFDLLLWRFRQQSREKAKVSGASPKPTELGVLLEEISERETSRIYERIL